MFLRRHILILSLVVFVSIFAAPDAHAQTSVPIWKQFRATWTAAPGAGNPFDTEFTFDFVHWSSSTTVKQYGFYSGSNTWNVYFMPNRTGEWRFFSSSTLPALHGLTGSFTATSATLSGKLEPSGKRWKNGTPFIIPVAVASKTYFKLNPTSTLQPFFNWAKTTAGAELVSFPLVTFTEGEASEPYLRTAKGVTFNEPLWARLNTHFDYLRDLGMGAHVSIFSPGGDSPSTNGMPEQTGVLSAADLRLFRYMIARLAPYPEVLWDAGEGISAYRSAAWIDAFAAWFNANDPWKHPVASRIRGSGDGTKNPSAGAYTSDGITPLPAFATIASTWNSRSEPTFFAGRWQESTTQNRAVMRRLVWESAFLGGSGFSLAGSVNNGYLSSGYANELTVAPDIKRMLAYFETNQIRLDRLAPAQSMVKSGAASMAQDGSNYYAYFPQGGLANIDFTSKAGRSMMSEWYNPRDNTITGGISFLGGAPMDFIAPTAVIGEDWVLKVKDVGEVQVEYDIKRVQSPPVLDGVLSEYKEANIITDIELPGGGRLVGYGVWDETSLYLGLFIQDEELLASATARDGAVTSDDAAGWFIDRGGEGLSGMYPGDFLAAVNVLNAQYDVQGTAAGTPNIAWNGSWQSVARPAGTVNDATSGYPDSGFTVEMRIPWRELGMSASANLLFRGNVALYDRDASGMTKVMWPSATSNFENSSQWPLTVLVDESAPGPTDLVDCHSFANSGATVPEGYGVPWNVFTTAKELLLKVQCSVLGAQFNVGVGDQQQYIYRYGYDFVNNAWNLVELQGANLLGGAWYVGSANTSIIRDNAGIYNQNWIVAYICHWRGNTIGWKCGCRDSTCATNHWMLQGFKRSM